MKKIAFFVMLSTILIFSVNAADLTLAWFVNNQPTRATGVGVNSSTFDPVSGEIIFANYGTDMSIERYSAADGSFIGTVALTTPGTPALGTLSGFGIGAAPDGKLYMSNDLDTGPGDALWRLDSVSDTSVEDVSAPGQNFPFGRNLSVVGSAENTYVAVTGKVDNGPIDIWKANDSSVATFSLWKTIDGAALTPVGAAKAGCALSPPNDDGVPEWVLGTDILGAISRMRLFRYNSTSTEYDLSTDVEINCYDADFDLTDSANYIPVVVVLRPEPSNANAGTATVEIYNFITSIGILTLQDTLIITDLAQLIGSRGSLDIDPATQSIYITYRGSTADNYCASKITYTRDEAPTASDGIWSMYE